jgi:hypothetical protein
MDGLSGTKVRPFELRWMGCLQREEDHSKYGEEDATDRADRSEIKKCGLMVVGAL